MAQKTDDVQILVRCSTDVRNRVFELAEHKGQSVTEWVRRAILQELEREEKGADIEYCLPDGSEVLTRDNLLDALRELKKEGFSFENL